MTESIVLDVLLGALILGYAVYGFRAGLTHALFAFAGVIGGVVAAFFLVPLIGTWVPLPAIRPAAVVLSALGLVALGHVIGSALGRALRRGIEETPLSGLDRLAGGVTTAIAAALVASVVAASAGPLGVPLLSRAIAGSSVLRTISAITPDPVEAWLAEARSAVVAVGLPVLTDALGIDPVVPHVDTGRPELTTAAASVVRISGNALACGVAQTGSGFVVSAERVVTNAHVVAGVSEPVVETPGGQALAASVVAFDPVDDLAILAVPGLEAAPLRLGATLPPGSDAAVQGYPFGGPFASIGAGVISVSTVTVADIYERSSNPREIYTLAAAVRPGNSGGPLLSLGGEVVGVIFAGNDRNPDVGYALTPSEVNPLAVQAPSLTVPVDSGACVPR